MPQHTRASVPHAALYRSKKINKMTSVISICMCVRTADSSSIDSCCTHSMHTGMLWRNLQPTSSKHGQSVYVRMYVCTRLTEPMNTFNRYNPYAEVSHDLNVTVYIKAILTSGGCHVMIT